MVLAALIWLSVMYTIGTVATLYKMVTGATQKVRTIAFWTTVLNIISIFAIVILWLN